MFRRGGLWNGLRYAAAVLLGMPRTWPTARFQRTRRLRVASSEEVPYQLDGNPGGICPSKSRRCRAD